MLRKEHVGLRQVWMKFVSFCRDYWRSTSLYLWFNAYLIFQLLALIIQPASVSFLALNPQGNVSMFLLFYLLITVGLLILHKIKAYSQESFFKILIIIYVLSLSFLTQAILIQLGLILILSIVLAHQPNLRQASNQALSLGIGGVGFRLIYLAFQVDQSQLDKFSLEASEPRLAFIFKLAVILMIFAGLSYLLLRNKKGLEHQLNQPARLKLIRLVTFLIISLVVVTVSIWLVSKEGSLSFGSFDKGIFSQMYANMAKGLGPVTTLERDRWLSHFSVHISPIYYLLLPIYKLWPSPATLEWLQVLVTFSALIPFKRIVNKLSLPPLAQVLLPLLLLFAPFLTSGHSYGFHENCFLPPVLFWLMALLLEGRPGWAFVATIVCLLIKEDAMLYVLAIGLYFAWEEGQKGRWTKVKWLFLGQILFPLIYFTACLYYLAHYGDGPMVSRFSNYMLAGENGLFAVIKNILLNPAYTLASLFSQEKLTYLLLILLSQAFLPIIQRDWHSYFLWLPLIGINLLSDYPYQVDPGFQYHYGSTSLLLFLSVRSLAQMYQRSKSAKAWTLTLVALFASLALWFQGSQGLRDHYAAYQDNRANHQVVIEDLKRVDTDKKILAYSHYTTHLSQASYLYDIFYHQQGEVDEEIDLLVFPRQLLQTDKKESEVIRKYLVAGYTLSPLSSERVLIYQKPS